MKLNDDRDIEVQSFRTRSHGASIFSEIGLLVAGFDFHCFGADFSRRFYHVQPVAVEGTSMLPQLHDGERIIVNKTIYYKFEALQKYGLWSKLERGDVVVFWYPNDPDKSYVKRVIGLPGENVELRNGVVFIDGQELKEPYLEDSHNQGHGNSPPTIVKQHYFFVMGDNRDNSSDSRSWGLVPEKYVYGKVMFRYYPFSDFGFITHGQSELVPNSNPNGHPPNGFAPPDSSHP